MGFSITHDGSDIDLAGFVTLLPFQSKGGNTGSVQVKFLPNRAITCCHLIRRASNQAEYKSPSSFLRGSGTFSLADDNNNVTLNSYLASDYIAAQSTFLGESVTILEGQNSTTNSIAVELNGQEISPWDTDYEETLPWKGELRHSEKSLLFPSYLSASVDLKSRYLTEVALSGPVVFDQGLFSWFLGACKWLKDSANGPVAQTTELGKLTIEDQRRDQNNSFEIFGTDQAAATQVQGTKGAVFLCNGSYSQPDAIARIRKLCEASLGGSRRDLRSAAAEVMIKESLDRALDAEATHGQQDGDEGNLHEGLVVWGLKDRKGVNKSFVAL